MTHTEALRLAISRLEDILKGDDGQAWKEAEKAMPILRAALAAPSVPANELRLALQIIDKHSVNTILGHSSDCMEWAEDIAYMGKVAREALDAPSVPSEPVATVGDLIIQVRERVMAAGIKNNAPLYAAPAAPDV